MGYSLCVLAVFLAQSLTITLRKESLQLRVQRVTPTQPPAHCDLMEQVTTLYRGDRGGER